MLINLCVILVAAQAVRIWHTSPAYAHESEAELAYSEIMAGNRSTTLLQPRSPPDVKATTAQMAGRRGVDKEIEKEVDALLFAAISEIINDARAGAKADHDHVFHQGYYRAVKAAKAAKAATEAMEEAITRAAKKAKVSGAPLVMKKLLEQTELGGEATLNQLMDHLEKQVKGYMTQVETQYEEHPDVAGLLSFLEDVKAMDVQIKARSAKANAGLAAFDSEAMTRMTLWIIRLMFEALRLDYKVKHETLTIPRALHQDEPPDMSLKMKSEIGLVGYLAHVLAMEKHLEMLEDKKSGKLQRKTAKGLQDAG